MSELAGLQDNIEPTELALLMERETELVLIDVREEFEWEICRLPGARLLPMSCAQEWLQELSESPQPLVIYCHHGVRSAQICSILRQLGAKKAINLLGGINRWSAQVDDTIKVY